MVYQVCVPSFADGDGDGTGDLRGLRARLPHLARLGVDALRLTSCHTSAGAGRPGPTPSAAHPADTGELVRAAHRLGILVLAGPGGDPDFDAGPLDCPWEAEALRGTVEKSLTAAAEAGTSATWVLSHHDAPRHRTRAGSLRRARAAALLLLGLPGSAHLYQGEELGLPETAGPPGAPRDPCRSPMPWSGRHPGNAGGPGPTPRAADRGRGGDGDRDGLTVAAQTGDPHSTLELYRAALELRRALPGLGAGDGPEWLPAPEGVLAFARPGFVCTASTRDAPVEMPVPGRPVLSSAPVDPAGRSVLIPGGSCTWWAI